MDRIAARSIADCIRAEVSGVTVTCNEDNNGKCEVLARVDGLRLTITSDTATGGRGHVHYRRTAAWSQAPAHVTFATVHGAYRYGLEVLQSA